MDCAETSVVDLGTAETCLKTQGKWPGRSENDLASAIKPIVERISTSMVGTVNALCICPGNGQRLPCDELEVMQNVVGDCQAMAGWTRSADALLKNEGTNLLDVSGDNVFIESLLSAVSISDIDIAREVVRGAQAPRLEQFWAIGDNVYVSGMDISWSNLQIGDLLVVANAVILNSGFPHFACWKYAARTGDVPRAYIKGKEGQHWRMRGIKGAVLLPSSVSRSACIKANDSIRIVRKGTSEYESIVKDCRPPLEQGTELFYCTKDRGTLRAAANDTQAYIDLLVCAGIDAARNDLNRYKRDLPDIVKGALGIPIENAPALMEISEAAKSGDGTTENVGIKTNGKFPCPDCRQKFDSERAKQLHWKFIHDPNRHQED